MASISTHVLDTSIGQPAAGVALRLQCQRPMGWLDVTRAETGSDGRVRDLATVGAGTYRITFDIAAYFARRGTPAFFPRVDVVFTVEASGHYHVPLLLSPFGYSTYRGS
jgi:5-hydroxyisourate hydrolase